MKKLFLLLLTAFFFIACEGPMGPMGPQGSPGKNGQNGQDGIDGAETKWKIEDFEIRSGDWIEVYDNSNLFIRYEYIFDFAELNEFIYNNGACITYLEIEEREGNNTYKIQKPLPYTITNEDSRGFLWEQRIDCDYSVGSIGFYATNTDFRKEPPGTLRLRVVLIW